MQDKQSWSQKAQHHLTLQRSQSTAKQNWLHDLRNIQNTFNQFTDEEKEKMHE